MSVFKRHGVFMANVATMVSGKTAAAAIALLTMPIIARLFTPEDFGVAALFLSLAVIISNVGALRYEVALVLPKEESEALVLLAFTYRALIAISAALLLLVAAYEISGLSIHVFDSLGIWLWVVPAGVLLLTMLQIQENWLARHRAFRVVATSMIVGTGITGGARIGLGLAYGSNVFGLIAGHMFGQLCRLFVQKRASRDGIVALLGKTRWPEMRAAVAKYADFPRLNAPAALMTAAAQQLPIVFLGVLFSPAIVGLYSMATRLSQAPIVIVANSVRRVFLQKAAEIDKRGRSLTFAYLTSTGALVLLGVGPLLLLWFFGQPLTAWLLGERWSDAGRYLEILSPWLFMLWVTAPANSVFIVLRRQRLWLSLQFVGTLFRLSAFPIAYVKAATPEWTLMAFVGATVVTNIAIILTAARLTTHTRTKVD
ncbi:oligosaccharide flippase family protein [soil metagenome]